jgi:hypothetical protein
LSIEYLVPALSLNNTKYLPFFSCEKLLSKEIDTKNNERNRSLKFIKLNIYCIVKNENYPFLYKNSLF